MPGAEAGGSVCVLGGPVVGVGGEQGLGGSRGARAWLEANQ